MEAVKRLVNRMLPSVNTFTERFGFQIVPAHYYSEVPSPRFLRTQTFWRTPWSMESVRGTATEPQLRFVRDLCAPYADHLTDLRDYDAACASNGEIGYGPIEAQLLYAFIRAKKPRRIIQVGCGVSTALILRAATDEGGGYKPDLVCVEPYPTTMLRDLAAKGAIRLIPEMAQVVDLKTLTTLDDGDLFFVDSTHTIKPGSEVLRVIYEVLPRLPVGAWVHFHDICFPCDFNPAILQGDIWYWRETALLLSFLTMNPAYEIAASMAMLQLREQPGLRAIFPCYQPSRMDGVLYAEPKRHFPSSIFLRRV